MKANPNDNDVNPSYVKDVEVLKAVDSSTYGDITMCLMYGDFNENHYVHINNSKTASSILIKECDLLDFLGVEMS